jgi:hypothetical protein
MYESTRDRQLTSEEAAKYDRVREQIASELPDLIAGHHMAEYGERNRRLRVIFDNGTESDLLMRSLQRALNKDENSRRIFRPDVDAAPLFSGTIEEGDLQSGTIYVLRSKSDHPFIAKNRAAIHKIGVTGGDVKTRVANARKDPTYLLADVEVAQGIQVGQHQPQKP